MVYSVAFDNTAVISKILSFTDERLSRSVFYLFNSDRETGSKALVIKSLVYIFKENGYEEISCSERKLCQMIIEAADTLGEVRKKVSRLEEQTDRPKLSRSSILTVLRKLEESGIIKDNVLDADELYRRLTVNDTEVIEDLNEGAFEELSKEAYKIQTQRIELWAKHYIDANERFEDKLKSLRTNLDVTFFEAWALIFLYSFGPKDMTFTRGDLNTLWTIFQRDGSENEIRVMEDGKIKDLSIAALKYADWTFFAQVLEEPFPEWVEKAKCKDGTPFKYWGSKFRLYYNWRLSRVVGKDGIRDGHVEDGRPETELSEEQMKKIGYFI